MAKVFGKQKGMIGSWAFLIGVVIAVIVGLLGSSLGAGVSSALAIILVVIGLVVGLLNVTESEATPFLMSGVILVITSYFGGTALQTISLVAAILNALLLIFVPATIIVAVKNVFSLTRS